MWTSCGRRASVEQMPATVKFTSAGEKDKEIPGGLLDRTLHGFDDRFLDHPFHRMGTMDRLDGVHPPLAPDHGCIVEQRAECNAVERGRHDEDPEVRTKMGAHIQCQRQSEVRVHAPLMEFIEDDKRDAGEFGLVLQHACQDPLGHDLDPRRGGHTRLTADPVTDRATDLLSRKRRHVFGSAACREAARFQHQDPSTAETGISQEGLRDPRGLACTGRSDQDRPAGRVEGCA